MPVEVKNRLTNPPKDIEYRLRNVGEDEWLGPYLLNPGATIRVIAGVEAAIGDQELRKYVITGAFVGGKITGKDIDQNVGLGESRTDPTAGITASGVKSTTGIK